MGVTIPIPQLRKLRPGEGRNLSKELSPGLRYDWEGTQLH